MDAAKLRQGWDTCTQINRALNRELEEAEKLLRLAQEAGVHPDIWDKIESFLNRWW